MLPAGDNTGANDEVRFVFADRIFGDDVFGSSSSNEESACERAICYKNKYKHQSKCEQMK
jgi:hypothetical protein